MGICSLIASNICAFHSRIISFHEVFENYFTLKVSFNGVRTISVGIYSMEIRIAVD